MALSSGFSVGFTTPGADESASGGPSGYLSAAIDDRENGRNDGRTSFAPGDTVYFHIFRSRNVAIDSVIASDGNVYRVMTVPDSVRRDVEIQFVNTDHAALSLPARQIVDYNWLGRSLGGLRLVDEQTIAARSSGIAVARVTIETHAWPWAINTPVVSLDENENYPIVVYIQGRYR